MLSLIASGALALLEKEFVNLEPEIQSLVTSELSKVADLLFSFVNSKIEPTSTSVTTQS